MHYFDDIVQPIVIANAAIIVHTMSLVNDGSSKFIQ